MYSFLYWRNAKAKAYWIADCKYVGNIIMGIDRGIYKRKFQNVLSHVFPRST